MNTQYTKEKMVNNSNQSQKEFLNELIINFYKMKLELEDELNESNFEVNDEYFLDGRIKSLEDVIEELETIKLGFNNLNPKVVL